MPEEILPQLFRIEVPLPRNPLRAINSYVIRDGGRSLIIDTGMNRPECLVALRSGLAELDVDLTRTDFFTTHMHADHSGLVSELSTESSTVYFSALDGTIVADGLRWDARLEYAALNGFPADQLRTALERHPGYVYRARGRLEYSVVDEGDEIAVGEYRFRCVATPGHTRGHMCLYEPDKGLLIAGDHVLDSITPNISLWNDELNPLADYLASLEKIRELNVELVLPGHRAAFDDCRRRIAELVHHHEMRVEEVLRIVRDGTLNAYRIASRMTWDLTYDSWDAFPVAQKWFATGEAISHLRYLEAKGLVRRATDDGQIVFCVA